ncbi:MAG: nitrophenyl compound nitroreductase subunit ArsF family protein [Armatimonadota bacterium]
MAVKKWIGVALLLFVALALWQAMSEQGAVVSSGLEKDAVSRRSSQQASAQIPSQGKHVVLYYFHTTFRCASCLTIEKTARQVVSERFKKQVDSGGLQFYPVDVEEPQNRHYIEDYQLYSKSLVLVEYRDGKEVRHKNLEGIWQQTSLEGLRDYLAQEISTFVEDTRKDE